MAQVIFEENECHVTGAIIRKETGFAHNPHLTTLKISARSRGKTFDDPEMKLRQEYMVVELHDRAAAKANLLEEGDLVLVKGQLSTREWEEPGGIKVKGLIIVASTAESIGKIGELKKKCSKD